MQTHLQKQEDKDLTEDKQLSPKNLSESACFPFTDNRPEAMQLKRMQTSAQNAPLTQNLIQLKEKADERAAEQPFGNAEAPIQLLKIGGKNITKSGETGRWLQGELKKFLLDNGMSPHGFVTFFKDKIVPLNDDLSLEDFKLKFKLMAEEELERVETLKQGRKKGDARIKSWTRVLKLNRPAWTKEHKEMGGAGQDIRHIVRNATIKNAIYEEYKFQKEKGNEKEFFKIAEALKIEIGSHPWEAMKNVYNKAYLNRMNLFAGGGGVNRVIGLTADPLIAFGQKIKENILTKEQEVNEIYSHVDKLIQEQIAVTFKQGEKLKKGQDEFQEGMEDFYETITDFLDDAHGQWLEMVDNNAQGLGKIIGHEIIDIGLNFGFDMPAESNPELTKRLLLVEETLGNYTPGNPGELIKALSVFLT